MPKAKSKSKSNLSKRVSKLEKAQELLGKPEFKAIYTDSAATDTYNGASGSMILLNGLSQGDGISSREGRKVVCKSVQCKLLFTTSASMTNAAVVRAILFIDRSPDGVSPSSSELLDTTHGARNEAFRNLDYRERFVILKDKTFVMYAHPPYDSAKTETNYKFMNFVKYKKLKLNTIFDASNNGDITDITNGAIYLYLYGTSATYPITCDTQSVVRFIDL